MTNIGSMSDISIEQFAAFLDGNLSEADMQTVSDAIDGNPMYLGIIGDVMNVDDYAESIGADDVLEINSILGEDFVLPEIPGVDDDLDSVDVVPVNADNNDSDVTVISREDTESPVLTDAQNRDPELLIATHHEESVEFADNTPTISSTVDTEVHLEEPIDSTTDIDFNNLA